MIFSLLNGLCIHLYWSFTRILLIFEKINVIMRASSKIILNQHVSWYWLNLYFRYQILYLTLLASCVDNLAFRFGNFFLQPWLEKQLLKLTYRFVHVYSSLVPSLPVPALSFYKPLIWFATTLDQRKQKHFNSLKIKVSFDPPTINTLKW